MSPVQESVSQRAAQREPCLEAGSWGEIIGPRWERVQIQTDLEKRDLKHGEFIDIAAKARQFTDVDFSFSVFTRAYFHDAVFRNCNFIGCRFESCNFRGASFARCDFRYASFDKTIIHPAEIIANAPEWPNVKKDLMQILRANAETIGDYGAQKVFIREEMAARREHLRRARERKESYYKEKYQGIQAWCSIRYQSVVLWLDRHILGHGEHLGRAALGSSALLLLISLILFLMTQSWDNDPTVSSVLGHLWLCVQYVIYTLSLPAAG